MQLFVVGARFNLRNLQIDSGGNELANQWSCESSEGYCLGQRGEHESGK